MRSFFLKDFDILYIITLSDLFNTLYYDFTYYFCHHDMKKLFGWSRGVQDGLLPFVMTN